MPDETKIAAAAPLNVKAEMLKEISLPTAVLAMDGDEKGEHLFVACLDGGIYSVEAGSGKYQLLGKHTSYGSGIQLSRKRKILISSGYDGALHWYDVLSSQLIRTLPVHRFWSWQLHLSPDEKWVASSTGQYLAGGYKYEPAAETEPSVKVFDVETGALKWAFSHVPPVQSVAFSPDGMLVAAGNMMGEVRVWSLESGKQISAWTTPAFTSWGIIKSHHYCGGIFDLVFTPDSQEIYACGMGPMIDPMAGNGKQTWQRFSWKDGKILSKSKDGDCGNGLMETIQFHPTQPIFVMGGRLVQGKWNVAFFETASGKMIQSLDNKMRVTDTLFLGPDRLAMAGAVGQGHKKDGKCPDFGKIKIYSLV